MNINIDRYTPVNMHMLYVCGVCLSCSRLRLETNLFPATLPAICRHFPTGCQLSTLTKLHHHVYKAVIFESLTQVHHLRTRSASSLNSRLTVSHRDPTKKYNSPKRSKNSATCCFFTQLQLVALQEFQELGFLKMGPRKNTARLHHATPAPLEHPGHPQHPGAVYC